MMKTYLQALLAISLIVLLAGVIFIYSGVVDVSAQSQHNYLTSWVLTTIRERAVMRRAESITSPKMDDAQRILAGVNDYAAMCVGCHGAPGKPLQPLAKGLNPPPPDLQKLVKQRSIEELFWVTKYGIKMTGMPAWGKTHSDNDLWSVIAFVRTLPDHSEDSYLALLNRAKEMSAGHHGNDSESDDQHEHDSMTSDEYENGLQRPDLQEKHDHHSGDNHAH